MNPSANDWASSDPTQNISLAEADQFKNELASALAVQFVERFVKAAGGDTISEAELRRSNPVPSAPVNLWGILEGIAGIPVNVAQMRSAIRAAARSSNPVGELEVFFRQALPKSDFPAMLLRLPAVAAALALAIARI